MSVIRGVKDRRFKFVQLLNSMFEDPELSLKAKGFIGFCLTKKEDWDFHISHLCKVLKEGEDAIYSTIKECIEHGYAYRYRTRDAKGQLTEVEYFICDSKEELTALKKELDASNEFNKLVPQRENPGVDNPRRENPHLENPGVGFPGVAPLGKIEPIYSNTDNSNIRKQQQEAAPACPVSAAVFSKNDEKEQQQQKSKIRPMSIENIPALSQADIPHADKLEILHRYTPAAINNAIEWTKKTDRPIKCLAAAIKWACKTKPQVPVTKEDAEKNNKAYAMRYDEMHNGISTVRAFNKCVEISNNGVNGATAIGYDESGFMEQFHNALRKNNLNILE